jgi:hypothetical protein
MQHHVLLTDLTFKQSGGYPEMSVSPASMYMVALIVGVLVMTVVGVLETKWR